jgi:hypothetical protein
MGLRSLRKLRRRGDSRRRHCGGLGSVPAVAAGGPIWIGGAVGAGGATGALCAREAGRAGPAGRFWAAAAGGATWVGGSVGSLVMMLTGGIEAADGKLMPGPGG